MGIIKVNSNGVCFPKIGTLDQVLQKNAYLKHKRTFLQNGQNSIFLILTIFQNYEPD